MSTAREGREPPEAQEESSVKRLRITVNGVSYEVEVEVLEETDADVSRLFVAPPPGLVAPPVAAPQAPAPQPAPMADGANVLTSPIAGIVTEVRVSIGAKVKENDPLVVIEAMKMNTNVASPVAGTIRSINVKAGESVRQGQPLLEFA